MNTKITIEQIKSILLEVTRQLKNEAPTNQNWLPLDNYIAFKIYDSGFITHFAIIKKKKCIPDSVVEINYDPYNTEFNACDKDGKFVFDILLDDMIEEGIITEKMLLDFIREYEKYYNTYVYSDDED